MANHAMVSLVYEVLDGGTSLPERGVARIRQELAACISKGDFAAVNALLETVGVLGKSKSLAAVAGSLCDVILGFGDELKAAGAHMAEAMEAAVTARATFARFSGNDATLRAPMVNQAPAPGTLKAGDLARPRPLRR